jgi:hypothetical protein
MAITGPRADRGTARKPDRPGFAAALRPVGRRARTAGRARGADFDHRGRRLRSRHGNAGRAHAPPCGIQAPAGSARRESDLEEFRPRSPLPDREPFSRSWRCPVTADGVASQGCGGKRSGGFLATLDASPFHFFLPNSFPYIEPRVVHPYRHATTHPFEPVSGRSRAAKNFLVRKSSRSSRLPAPCSLTIGDVPASQHQRRADGRFTLLVKLGHKYVGS